MKTKGANLPFSLYLLLLFLFLGMMSASSQAQMITVSLYHGQNEDVRNDLKPEHPLRKSLDRLIGYRFYERIGMAACNLESSYDQWILPSKMFFLRFNRPSPNSEQVTLELFQEKKSIFKGKFVPKIKRPLIITGPLYSNGQLVLILTCRQSE